MSDFTKGFGNLGSLVGSTAASAVGNASSGLTGAIFGGLQAKRNWKYQQKAMNLQQKYNLENMQKQFEYQQEAWNRENQYNDPRNAVARWRLAGISPQAVYGNSPGGAGIAGSAGTPDSSNPSTPGNVDTTHFSPSLTPAEMARLRNDTNVANSVVNLNNAKADEARGNTKDPDETKRGQKLYNDGLDLTNKLTASKVINQNTQNELDSLDLRMKNELFDTTVQIEKQKAENLAKQYEQMNQQIAESVSRERLNKAQREEVLSRMLLNAAYARLANTQAEWHGKVSQAQIDESLSRLLNFNELRNLTAQKVETERENTALQKFNAMLRSQEAEVLNSDAGELVRIVDALISAISPLKFGK